MSFGSSGCSGDGDDSNVTLGAVTIPVAVGDSRSDVPLFTEVGLSVAFNADAHVRGTADVVVDGPDLRLVLPALGSWLDRLPAGGTAVTGPRWEA